MRRSCTMQPPGRLQPSGSHTALLPSGPHAVLCHGPSTGQHKHSVHRCGRQHKHSVHCCGRSKPPFCRGMFMLCASVMVDTLAAVRVVSGPASSEHFCQALMTHRHCAKRASLPGHDAALFLLPHPCSSTLRTLSLPPLPSFITLCALYRLPHLFHCPVCIVSALRLPAPSPSANHLCFHLLHHHLDGDLNVLHSHASHILPKPCIRHGKHASSVLLWRTRRCLRSCTRPKLPAGHDRESLCPWPCSGACRRARGHAQVSVVVPMVMHRCLSSCPCTTMTC